MCAARATRSPRFLRWGIALALGPRTNDPEMTMRMGRAFNEAQSALALSRDRSGLARDLCAAVVFAYIAACWVVVALLILTFGPRMNKRTLA